MSNSSDEGPIDGIHTTTTFKWLAVGSMIFISSVGIIVNTFVLIKLYLKLGKRSGFQKLCIFKTLPNIAICCTFLLWAVPVSITSITYDETPLQINRAVGLLSGTEAYIFGPLIQTCMSFNRFFLLYFPFKSMTMSRFPATNIAIIISFIIATGVCIPALPAMCGFVYDPDYYIWRPEVDECGDWNAYLILYIIISLAVISNFFNMATASKLLREKVGGMSHVEATRRRKKWLLMFTQSVIQDCLHLIDIINTMYTYQLSDEVWFQFIFLSVSFVTICALDGCIMLLFHPEAQPKWLRSIFYKPVQNTIVIFSTTKISY